MTRRARGLISDVLDYAGPVLFGLRQWSVAGLDVGAKWGHALNSLASTTLTVHQHAPRRTLDL